MTIMKAFVQKFARDWSTNLAAMLTYHLIVMVFPILLAALSVAGMLLHAYRATHLKHDLAVTLNHLLPRALQSAIGVNHLLDHLIRLTGPLAVVSLLGLLLAGSGLFSSMENAFSIVFRSAGRAFLRQKLLAAGLSLVFALLLSVSLAVFFVTMSDHAIAALLAAPDSIVLNGVGLLISLGILWLLFLLIYRVVPTVAVPLRSAWRGALVAALLVTLLNLLFPLIFTLLQASDLRYGVAAATALVIVIWLWLLALITVVGAQITALSMGRTPARCDLARALALDDERHTALDTARDVRAQPPRAAGAACRDPLRDGSSQGPRVDTLRRGPLAPPPPLTP